MGGPILTLSRSWALSPGVWAPWPVALCSSARRCCRAASWAVHVAPAANFRVWLPRFQQQLACNRMRRARHSHAPLPGIFERSPSPLYTAHPNLLNRRLGRPPLGSPRGPAGSPSERHAGCVRIGDFFSDVWFLKNQVRCGISLQIEQTPPPAFKAQNSEPQDPISIQLGLVCKGECTHMRGGCVDGCVHGCMGWWGGSSSQ